MKFFDNKLEFCVKLNGILFFKKELLQIILFKIVYLSKLLQPSNNPDECCCGLLLISHPLGLPIYQCRIARAKLRLREIIGDCKQSNKNIQLT